MSMPQGYTVPIREERQGIMLHYDASVRDRPGLSWLRDNPFYQFAVEDDGGIHPIAPLNARSWHAGVCRPSEAQFTYKDANSAFFGVAILATDGDTATHLQKRSVAYVCLYLFAMMEWDILYGIWRITGHDREAWPRGRKIDPTGSEKATPVMALDEIRQMVLAKRKEEL